jgi:hypothetical protein
MSNKFISKVEKLGIFTAVISEIIAIMVILIPLLQNIHIELPEISLGAFIVPYFELGILLFIYGFLIAGFLITRKLRYFINNTDELLKYTKLFSLSFVLLLGIPITTLLSTNNKIAWVDGLATILLFFASALAINLGWKKNFFSRARSIIFDDIGLSYFIVIPLVWFCFQLGAHEKWMENVGWAAIYGIVGYITTLGIVFITKWYLYQMRHLAIINLKSGKDYLRGENSFLRINIFLWAIAFLSLAIYIAVGLSILSPPLFFLFCIILPCVIGVIYYSIFGTRHKHD